MIILCSKYGRKRTFLRNQTFPIGDFAYFFAPSTASWQLLHKKWKEDWIGFLQITAVFDKSQYLLVDWHGNLLLFFSAVHKNILKPFYLNLGKVENKLLTSVSNVKWLRDELQAFQLPWKCTYKFNVPMFWQRTLTLVFYHIYGFIQISTTTRMQMLNALILFPLPYISFSFMDMCMSYWHDIAYISFINNLSILKFPYIISCSVMWW